jgi:hypothetical protein
MVLALERPEAEDSQSEFPSEFLTQKELDPDAIAFNSQNNRYHFPARFYLPFRGVFGQVDPLFNRYTNQQAGLIPVRKRNHSPDLGKLLSRAPARFDVRTNLFAYLKGAQGGHSNHSNLDRYIGITRGFGATHTSDLYSYAVASPVNNADPFGLYKCSLGDCRGPCDGSGKWTFVQGGECKDVEFDSLLNPDVEEAELEAWANAVFDANTQCETKSGDPDCKCKTGGTWGLEWDWKTYMAPLQFRPGLWMTMYYCRITVTVNIGIGDCRVG